MNYEILLNQFHLSAQNFSNLPWHAFRSITIYILVTVFVLWLLFIFIQTLLILLKLRSDYTFLEVKPLKDSEKSSYTTQQFFTLIHGIGHQQSLLERIFNVSINISLEIIATKGAGIRYVMRIPTQEIDLVKRTLVSYLPGLKITELHENPLNLSSTSSINEFDLSKHFAYPLRVHEKLDQADPIAYLTGNMTKLSKDETVSFQLVVSPLNKSRQPEIQRISKLIYTRKDLLSAIKTEGSIKNSLKLFTTVILQIITLPLGIMVFVFSDGKEGPLLTFPSLKEKSKTNNPYQQELETLIKQKLELPLFRVSIRTLAISDNRLSVNKRQKGFASSLMSMSYSGYQSLKPKLKINNKYIQKIKWLLFKLRAITPFSGTLLSVSEVGDLYHFPYTKTTKTEDLLKEHSKELPAPHALKKASNLDITFALNTYGSSSTPIGLTQEERRRHMYVLGATGTGKTTMLLSMIHEDLKNNKGLCLIDPHGDLTEDILHIIPENRIKDVVYFNPDDIGYPMGINLLELTKGLDEEDATREKEFLAESIISLFHKIYTEKYSGPRMEYILRNTIHTAFTVPDATLFTVYKLLINTKYRKSVVKNITDENLKDFWKYEFAKAGDYQKVKMISPITNKIGRFLFSPTAKRILEQEKSTVSFEDIMNQGKILLCNVSKGKIGEDNSEVFGVMIMTKLQLAALKRARMPMEDRRDFYLYVDEFQNFATPAFAQILSEARKYRLNAILAHQTTSQLEDSSLVNVTLANTGTVICFRTANPEDEKVILPQFRPYIEQGEISSLPSYRFYMRLGALNPEEPFSGITTPLEVTRNKDIAKRVIESSRKNYAIRFQEKNGLNVPRITKRQSKVIRNRITANPGILP
ncbi:type IV secretion system DNA-binding domain-containing protein [Candidatus Nomurabacteria bacterium]|nr:type IV secretion system DNA-binding domain-containing protein [Candidatus Nomurabacteria bacterium]